MFLIIESTSISYFYSKKIQKKYVLFMFPNVIISFDMFTTSTLLLINSK